METYNASDAQISNVNHVQQIQTKHNNAVNTILNFIA